MNRFYKTDLKRSAVKSRLIVAILTISFLGPLLSSLLRSSVEGFLNENSRRILTADIAVTAYRPIRDDEIQRLSAKYGIRRLIHETEFATMANGRDNRTSLLEVHAVENGFPIDGEFVLSDGSKLKASPAGDSAWLSEDALTALDLKPGDEIQFGKTKFKIEHSIQLAPGVSRSTFGFAPRAYIAVEKAVGTGLLGFGSQIYYRNYIETVNPVRNTEEVKAALGDPDLFLRTPDDSIQGVERFTGFVSLYLSVVSVSLFALGWAAAFYIIRTQAIERMRAMAVALVFGATTKSALRFEFLRIAVLTIAASAAAFLLAYAVGLAAEPFIAKALSENVSGGFHIGISWRDIAALGITALASSLIFTLPFARRLSSSNLGDLFQDSAVGVDIGSESEAMSRAGAGIFLRYANWWTGFFAVCVLAALSVWLTREIKLGLELAGGFVIASAFIHFTGIAFFRGLASIFGRAGGRTGSLLRLAGTQLGRARFAVRLSFLAIGLSAFVASAVGHVMVSLGDELANGARLESAPDFFLFNIPESELENVQTMLAKQNTRLDFVSPQILARIKTLNGKPIDNEQFQKFPVRITWREKPIPSEKIVEGRAIEGSYVPANGDNGKLPALSVELRFAERNGFKIGDRLMFDVQGVPVEGEIRNLRRVRWTDFNPNFFISFQSGVLEDAPKTWLGNVRVTDRTARPRVQSEIVRAFPELSLIEVSQTLERVAGLARAILGPAEKAAWLSSLFSILVLVTIVGHSIRLRAKEMNLFRILGAEPRRVKQLYRMEFALASGLGSLVGAGGGLVLAWLVATRFLELEFRFNLPRFFATVAIGVILGTSLGDWLFRRVSRGLGFKARVV